MLRWHTLATYFRLKYGFRVQKIPLNANFTCPNRDGQLSHHGCIFCNPDGSGVTLAKNNSLQDQWHFWQAKYLATDQNRKFMAYLQSFSNTYCDLAQFENLLKQIALLPDCFGVAIGTRPDCLDAKKLALLAQLPFSERWLELGLQSYNNKTLNFINRCHTAEQSEVAINLAAQFDLKICVHLMAGLPNETEQDFCKSVEWALTMPIHALKLHNTCAPAKTALFELFKQGQWHPLSRDEYIDYLCQVLPIIPTKIVIQRLQTDLTVDPQIIPSWVSEKRGFIRDLTHALTARNLWQGSKADAPLARPEWFGG